MYWGVKRCNWWLSPKYWEMELGSEYFSEYDLWCHWWIVILLPSILAHKHCLISWEIPFRQLWERKSSSQPLSVLLLYYQDNACLTEPWTLDSTVYNAMPRKNISFISWDWPYIIRFPHLVFHYPAWEGRTSVTYLYQWIKNVYIFCFCMKHENLNTFDNIIFWTINFCPQKSKKCNGEQWFFLKKGC